MGPPEEKSMHPTNARMSAIGFAAVLLLSVTLPTTFAEAKTGPECEKGALPEPPGVRLTSVTHETAPVPHCKVAGVIGT